MQSSTETKREGHWHGRVMERICKALHKKIIFFMNTNFCIFFNEKRISSNFLMMWDYPPPAIEKHTLTSRDLYTFHTVLELYSDSRS